MPVTSHSPSGVAYTPVFTITLAISQLPFAQALAALLGGHVRKMPKKGACRIVIESKTASLAFITVIASFIRTPKINRLNAAVTWFNLNRGCSIPAVTVCTASPLEDAWFAGFCDGDANVYVRVTEAGSGSKPRVSVRLRIEQRQIDPSYGGGSFEPIMAAIAALLQTKLGVSSHHGDEYWCVSATSAAS